MNSSAVYDATAAYPRDLIGYGRTPPPARWPGGARVAVQFVLNYEEGGENCVLHGDPASEQFLSEMFNPAAYPERHMSMEGIYEYGARAGVWRILREFEKRGLPLTVFGVATALQRHREVAQAFAELGAQLGKGLGHLAVALQRRGHAKHGKRQAALFKFAQDAPHAGTGAVLVDALHAHVALGVGRRVEHLGQELLAGRVAVQHAVLAPFFVVQYKLHRHARAAGPAGGRGRAAVADQVAWVGSGGVVNSGGVHVRKCLRKGLKTVR